MAIENLNQLREFDLSKKIVFAYLTCERLYPNYVYFEVNFSFGNSQVLREAIDFVYNNLFEHNPNKSKIKSLLKKLEVITPDTEDFDTSFVSSALDACTAVEDTLSFFLDNDFSRITYISAYGTDTVDMHIQEIEELDYDTDKNFQNKIDTHPLMQREVATQSAIINFLSSKKNINTEDVRTLLSLQENNKKGSLDL